MKQPKLMSFIESLVNILVGLGVAMAANAIILPLVGFDVSLKQNTIIAALMTVISIARSYGLRRLFEALHIRRPLSPAMAAIIAERWRQIEVEGWSHESDDKQEPGDMARAGAAYADAAPLHLRAGNQLARGKEFYCPNMWPWSRDWWKPQDFRRDLVRAGALIVAELERWDRNRKPKRSD